jgi:hypothetical protein
MTLCRPSRPSNDLPTISVIASDRRAIQRHDLRVAVWDIDNRFPSLAQTLRAMSVAQKRFGLETTSMSVPLNVWDNNTESPDGYRYLVAEKLASRLKSAPLELGTDLIVCITHQWLRDAVTRNLYAWWSAENANSILILSFAGFDDIPAAGKTTDRVIANMLVSVLAGRLGEMGSHERKTGCPLYYNERRETSHLTNRQRFDAACAAELKKRIPKEFPALETLLKLFD